MWSKRKIQYTLKRHYLVPLEVSFRQFRNGLIYFAVGFMTVLMANAYMEPSVWQELTVLGGLCLGGIGFVIALLAQTRLIISRFVQFWLRKNPSDKR